MTFPLPSPDSESFRPMIDANAQVLCKHDAATRLFAMDVFASENLVLLGRTFPNASPQEIAAWIGRATETILARAEELAGAVAPTSGLVH